MGGDTIQLALSVAAAALYAAQLRRPSGRLFAAGAVAHALSLVALLIQVPYLHLSLLLSLFMLATLLACWKSLAFGALRRLLLALAAAAALAPLLLPQTASAGFSLHGLLALAVYALAAVAFFLCLDLRLAEQQLRRQPQGGGGALLARENRCFHYVGGAFVLLTLTLLSGMFSAAAAGTAVFELTHKSLFAYLTWAVFLALLAGRRLAGWRGRLAQRWFFTGYAFLLLSYIGSTVVAKLILG